MVVQCPQCATGHILDEEEFDGQPQMEIECTKCQNAFVVRASSQRATDAQEIARKQNRNKTITVMGVRTKLPKGKNVALVAMEGPLKGTVFRLTKPEVVIGRIGTDLVVNDPEISATHCAVEVRGDYGVLTDMGSTNGTYVGEEPIKSFRLEHMTEFRIGSTTLMFTITHE